MAEQSRLGEPGRLWERIALAACGLFFTAAIFTPWDWPSVDGFPAIERFLDPTFLSHDFYTNTTSGYSVDSFIAWLFGGLQKATGISYVVWMAVFNLVRCLTWPLCLFIFFHALSRDRLTALSGVVLGTASMFAFPNLPAWAWLWGDPSTAMFAVSLIVLAWAAFLNRSGWSAMLWMALAALFHPLMVVHGGVFIALIYFVDYSRKEKLAALFSPANIICGAVFALVFIAQYVLLSSGSDEKIAADTYTHIIANERHPGDFLPSLFGLRAWLEAGLAVLGTGLILWWRRDLFAHWKLVVAGIAAYLVIGLCGYLFVEVWPVRFFVELIPFRNVIMGAPLILFVLARLSGQVLAEGRVAWFLGLLLIFFLFNRVDDPGLVSSGLAALVFAWTLATLLGLARWFTWADRLVPSRMTSTGLVVASALALAVLAVPAGAARWDEMQAPTRTNQHPVYAWMEAETPPDAMVLVDQYASGHYGWQVDPQRMRLIGRRAVVASKDFPFLDRDIEPWYERWSLALDHGRYDYINKADTERLDTIAATFAFDYVVRDRVLENGADHYRLVAELHPDALQPAAYVYQRLAAEPS